MTNCHDCQKTSEWATLVWWVPRRAALFQAILICEECQNLSAHLHRLARDNEICPDPDALADLSGRVWVSILDDDVELLDFEDENAETEFV